jgi:hypothetical protein
MKRFRQIVILISALLIIAQFLFINYSDLFSRQNLGSFMGIIAMVLNIIALILSNRHEAGNELQKSTSGRI